MLLDSREFSISKPAIFLGTHNGLDFGDTPSERVAIEPTKISWTVLGVHGDRKHFQQAHLRFLFGTVFEGRFVTHDSHIKGDAQILLPLTSTLCKINPWSRRLVILTVKFIAEKTYGVVDLYCLYYLLSER